MGIDTFDCALPTRLGRHGVALVPDPDARWRVDLVKGRWRDSPSRSSTAAPVPRARAGSPARYLHYLLRAGELTALRLVTLHNLSFIARLMADLRAAIDGGRLPAVAAALRAGAAPGAVVAVARRLAVRGGRATVLDRVVRPRRRATCEPDSSACPDPIGPHKHGDMLMWPRGGTRGGRSSRVEQGTWRGTFSSECDASPAPGTDAAEFGSGTCE